MKKNLIAAIIGGIIIFFWQFLSNAALDLHRPGMQYTAKQDTIVNFLNSQLEEGRYFLPTYPANASSEEAQAAMANAQGKPWAIVELHKNWDQNDMTMNLIRSLLVNILAAYIFIWFMTRMGLPSLGTFTIGGLIVGFLAFLTFPYPTFIWYKTPGVWPHFLDGVVAWTAAAAFIGWFMNRKKA